MSRKQTKVTQAVMQSRCKSNSTGVTYLKPENFRQNKKSQRDRQLKNNSDKSKHLLPWFGPLVGLIGAARVVFLHELQGNKKLIIIKILINGFFF